MKQSPAYYKRQIFGTLIGMTPLLVLGNSVFHALMYTFLYLIMMFGTYSIMYLFRTLVPLHQRLAYTVLSSAFVLSIVYFLGELLVPGTIHSLGVFFPLLGVQPSLLGAHSMMRMETKFGSIVLHIFQSVATLYIAMMLFALVRSGLGAGELIVWRSDTMDLGLSFSSWFSRPARALLDTSMAFILVGIALMLVPLDKEEDQ